MVTLIPNPIVGRESFFLKTGSMYFGLAFNSLCSLGWPQTCGDPPASASRGKCLILPSKHTESHFGGTVQELSFLDGHPFSLKPLMHAKAFLMMGSLREGFVRGEVRERGRKGGRASGEEKDQAEGSSFHLLGIVLFTAREGK